MCVCVNLETYDREIPWKDGSEGRGGGAAPAHAIPGNALQLESQLEK